jgi:hypothetical protein
MSSFASPKRLRVTLTLAESANTVFDTTGNNTLVLTDARVSAQIQANARQATQANVKIWGMRLEDMDAMTAAWLDPTAIRQNLITIEADNGNGFLLVYTGQILEAQPDFTSIPEVSFQILSTIKYFQQIDVADALSYEGDVGIETLGRHLAEKLGLSFVAAPGLNVTFNNPNFSGSYFTQLREVAMAGKVEFYFVDDKLVFAPRGQSLEDRQAVVLSPATGLLGYPMYSHRGLVVNAIFNPAFACAVAIDIENSLVRGANGRWNVFALTHHLESRVPNGKWTTNMQCNKKI